MRRGTAVLLVAAWLVSTVAGAGPKARITLEVLTKPGLPPAATQQWYQALSNLGLAGLQVHSGRAADEANIREQGTKASPAYKVVGILSADNVLYLPGGKFRSGETARLKKWLDELADQGAEGVTERRTAFAFTPRQFDDVKADLKKPVAFFTKGVPTSKVINKMARGLKYSFEIDDGAKRAVAGVEVADELNGLSTGTALAAVLRPCGLAFEPQRPTGGEIRYRIEKAQAGREAWPIGWKPREDRIKVLPEMFEHLNVEISEISVSQAIDAIQGRLKVPFLYDQNAMALHGVDPADVQADVPNKRMTYSQVLGKVLLQAKLQYELRVDDADKPFLWITTVKPAP